MLQILNVELVELFENVENDALFVYIDTFYPFSY